MSRIAPAKQRQACDRCHTHKLRCHKRLNSDTCVRCSSVSAECVFSISRRGCRPKKNTPEQVTDDITIDPNVLSFSPNTPWDNGSLAYPLDVSFLGNSADAIAPFASIDQQQQHLSNGLSLSTSSQQAPALSTDATLDQQLARLSHSLSEHQSSISAFSIWSSPSDGRPKDLHFSIGDTFSVTQKLVDSYNEIDSRHLCQVSSNSLIYLLLACHHRVLDIWECLFEHMQHCIDSTQKGLSVAVPTVVIGSFVASSSMAVHLHMALIFRLSEQLHLGINSLIAELSRMETTSTDASSSMDVSAEVLTANGQSLNALGATIWSCRVVAARASKMLSNLKDIDILAREYGAS